MARVKIALWRCSCVRRSLISSTSCVKSSSRPCSGRWRRSRCSRILTRLARTEGWRGYRNGYGPRQLRTRIGILYLLIPMDREAGFMDGYAAGKAEGSAANAASGGTRFGRARPRSRGHALAILNLPTGASTTEMERRFKELRFTIHPDAVRAKRLPKVVEFAEEHFKLIGEAHDILRQVGAN